MNRRDTIKWLGFGTLGSGVLVEACKSKTEIAAEAIKIPEAKYGVDRFPAELAHEKEVQSKTFFTVEEMATIGILSDIIIPKDSVSGSATDAKVPDFIEFIVKDMPGNQTPMRGGLRWVDLYCLRKYGKAFKDCDQKQKIELVDQIAYPEKAKPAMLPGVVFFNLMRDLTASGFYTSEIGVKDIGYAGSAPNQWNGVPDDVLKQYNLAYTEKELKECVSFDKPAKI